MENKKDVLIKCEITYSFDSEDKALDVMLGLSRMCMDTYLVKKTLELNTKFNDNGEKVKFDLSILCIGTDENISKVMKVASDLF